MINLREIFNPQYNIVGYSLIIIIILLIIIVNKDIRKALKSIAISLIISSIIIWIVSLLLKISLFLLIPEEYQKLINIITNNITHNLDIFALICFVLGIILIIISYIKNKNEKNL